MRHMTLDDLQRDKYLHYHKTRKHSTTTSITAAATITTTNTVNVLLLSGELLTEHCHTDDLMPSILVLCLLPSHVNPKVLRLNVLIYHSQPGGYWTTRKSPPIRWWSQCGGNDTVMVNVNVNCCLTS